MPGQDGRGVGPPAAAKTTILLVDDNADVREITGFLLGDLGYSVVEADSGPAALTHLEGGNPIDLVMTDLSMPGMSGFDMVTRARAKLPGLNVLFVTGFADAPHLENQMRGETVIKKPFTMTQLADAVRTALERAAAG
jgi:CheY-like chemotaxis protein